ncbi:MAG: hypothetical protein LC713_08090, partial [Actinobacteria bacterium]|nr:hypothetical protein [Actinomycetota bacterium]
RDVVLPNEDPEALQARLDEWADHYRPQDPAARHALERAVHATWRLDRCARYEAATLGEGVRHAADRHDLDRHADAAALGRRLLFEPVERARCPDRRDPIVSERLDRRDADDPAVLVRALEATAAGATWMLDRWGELAEALHRQGFWTFPEQYRAMRLLGARPEDALEHREAVPMFLAAHKANPEGWDLGGEVDRARIGTLGRPINNPQLEALKALEPADAEAGRAELRAVVAREVGRLEALLASKLEPEAEEDRESAEDRAMFDASEAGALRLRYESACERELRRSVAELEKRRKEAARAAASRPEPAPEAPAPAAEPPARNEPKSRPDADRPRRLA